MFGPVVCLALCAAPVGATRPPEVAPPALAQLRAKYTFQSIYLTTIPLHSLTVLLDEPAKYDKLKADKRWSNALPVLKKYLDDNKNEQLNKSIAFLQLDIRDLKAGVKLISDRTAAITQLPWAADLIIELGIFCDLFLSGQVRVEDVAARISASKTSVVEAWAAIGELKNDPFVPTKSIGKPLRDFQLFLGKKGDELRNLEKSDKPQFDMIQKFRLGLPSTIKDLELHDEEGENIYKQFKLWDRREGLRDVDTVQWYYKSIGDEPPKMVIPKGGKPSIDKFFTLPTDRGTPPR